MKKIVSLSILLSAFVFKAYLFLIDPQLKNEVFGKLRTGDFVYLEEKN